MSRKENQRKRIDDLCAELGITEPQYTDRTTEVQLNEIIDDLEEKLPKMGESDDKNLSQTKGNDGEYPTSDQSKQAESQSRKDSGMLTGTAFELPNNTTTLSAGEPTEVHTTEKANVKVFVDKSFQYLQDQKTVLLKSGDTPYLDIDTAMEAVEAGLATPIGQN